MTQQIIVDYPPNYDRIVARFPIVPKLPGVIFSWGYRIYNPTGGKIGPHLLRHEGVHGQRQGNDIEGWWDRYIEDQKFRSDEELAAHRAEYGWWVENAPRNERRQALKHIAKRYSGPLYGTGVNAKLAQGLIKRKFNGESK